MSELEMQNLAIWCNRCLGALTKFVEEVIEISVNWANLKAFCSARVSPCFA